MWIRIRIRIRNTVGLFHRVLTSVIVHFFFFFYSHLASRGLLSCEGFLWFLLSEDNNVISQEKLDKEASKIMSIQTGTLKEGLSCFLLVSRVWDIFSGIGPCFPLAGGLCKFYANAGGKQPIQRQLLLVQYKQQANPLYSQYTIILHL
jgi:hypothetical protein